MKQKIRSGHGLMLFEIILAIGFFTVFSAISLRIFMSAHELSLESSAVSQAILTAEHAAEYFKAGLSPDLYYDADWSPTGADSAVYGLRLSEGLEGRVRTAEISVLALDTETALFSLTVKRQEVEP